MVAGSPRILDHDELLERVWPGTFVEQGNLKKAVSALRRALGDSSDANEFIITVPRRGYRFGPAVRVLPDDVILVRKTIGEIIIEEEFDDQTIAPPAKQIGPIRARGPLARLIFVAAAIFALVVVAIAAWPYLRQKPLRFSAEKVDIKQLMSEGNVLSSAISADGRFMVYSLARGNTKSLWVRQVDLESGVQIVPPAGASFWDATFTPDASFIYYTLHHYDDPRLNGLYRIPTLGGTPQMLARETFTGLKFSPDGSRIAACRAVNTDGNELHELVSLNIDGSDVRLISRLPVNSVFRGVAWSPDGSSLIYCQKRQPPDEKPLYSVAEIAVTGGKETLLMPEQEKATVLEEWLPDRKSFLLRQREPHSELFQIWQYFTATGEFLRVTNDDYGYNMLNLSGDGKTIGATRSIGLVYIKTTDDRVAGLPRQVTTGTNSPFRLDWTGDGRIVFSSYENSSEYIAVIDADGTHKRLLTAGTDGVILNPRVAADGRTITFISDRGGARQIWRLDIDGTGLAPLTGARGVDEARLLADGQTVVYTAYQPATSMWCLYKQTGDGPAVQISDTDTHEWDLSPDEKYLAIYTPDPKTGKRRISVRELESGRETASYYIDGIACLRWTRPGDALNYVRSDEDRSEIVKLPLAGGQPSVITSLSGDGISNFSWSRDAKRLAVSGGRLSSEAVLIRRSE